MRFIDGLIRPDECRRWKEDINGTSGGAFHVSCGNNVGDISYGPSNASAKSYFVLQSSTQAPSKSAGCGAASSGTVWAYLVGETYSSQNQIAFQDAKRDSSLRNDLFPDKDFKLYEYLLDSHLPDYPLELGFPNKKHTLDFKSPLNGQNVPTKYTNCFELVQSP